MKRARLILIAWAGSWIVLAACNEEKLTAPLPVKDITAYQSCAQDSDCVYVQNGCCDCANGGVDTAVNKDRLKEFQALYGSWVATMVSSAKSFADESAKIQETWRSTVEKQMEMTREMVAKLSDLFKQAGEKK